MQRKTFLQGMLLFIGGIDSISCISNTMHKNKVPPDLPPLGLQYHPTASSFCIWAPTAQAVRLHLYNQSLKKTFTLQKGNNDLWWIYVEGDWCGRARAMT